MHLSPKITDILQVTQLITVFDVFDDEREALGSF
jgi:anti-sigma B factor antagonist